MDPFEPPTTPVSSSFTHPTSKVSRTRRVRDGALAILKEFFTEVSHNPTIAQRDELVARVKVHKGCEDWTRDHCSSWFSRQRKRHASKNGTGNGTMLPASPMGVQKSPKRKKTTGDILYPSLNNTAITQLEVLVAESPDPIPEVIEIWADRLGATAVDVTTWIKLQRTKVRAPAPVPQPFVSGSGSLPRDVEMAAGSSHLPTPAKSTSPETEPHHHHHPHHEDSGSNMSSPSLSSSSIHFPVSTSNTTQYPASEVGIKDESALYSPTTSRFPPLPPPPAPATSTFANVPSDAVSISSASVVSQMMRHGGDRDDQSCTSPVPPPRSNPNLIASSNSQNKWPHGPPPSVPPASKNTVTDMVVDPPPSPSAAPSSPSPVRISRELKLGFAAITSTFTPAIVTVTGIQDDCPKTLAEFNERFAKYESKIVDYLEKIDSGRLRAFGFDPAPVDPAP